MIKTYNPRMRITRLTLSTPDCLYLACLSLTGHNCSQPSWKCECNSYYMIKQRSLLRGSQFITSLFVCQRQQEISSSSRALIEDELKQGLVTVEREPEETNLVQTYVGVFPRTMWKSLGSWFMMHAAARVLRLYLLSLGCHVNDNREHLQVFTSCSRTQYT